MRQLGIVALLAATGLAACGSKEEANAVAAAEVPATDNNAVETVDAPLDNLTVAEEAAPAKDPAPAPPPKKAAAPPGDPPGSRCSRSTPEDASNRAPTVSLQAISTQAEGDGFVVRLRARATDPDKDPLLYSFTVTAGSTTSDGPELTWHLPEPGLYTATVEVFDRRGCTTFSSISQQVGKPPTP